MELELKQGSLGCWEMGGELTVTQEETAETIVPDYCPDVSRIIETTGAVYLHSRELRDGRAEAAGTVRVTVLYAGESGVRTLELTLPFTAEADSRAVPEGLLLAGTEAEFLETRLLNPRKLFTRCKLATRMTPLRRAPLPYTADVEAEEALMVEKRLEKQRVVLLSQAVEQEFSFTDQMELSPGRPGAAELLSAQVVPAVTETKIIGNKLALKGVFTVSLLYLSEEGALCSAVGELPFSQILDLDGSPEDAAARVRLQLNGLDLQISGGDPDGRLIEVTLYVHADALLRQEREPELLTDLYSTRYETRCAMEPLSAAGKFERQTRRQNVREVLEIGVAADTILSLSAVCGPVSVTREEGAAVLRTSVLVRALYLDEGGVPLTAERRVETGCRMEDLPEGGETTAEAFCPEAVQGSLSDRGIEVRFPVDFEAETAEPVRILYVASAELDREAPRDTEGEPSLVLRRLEAGETAWDLAKAYHASVRDILAANRLEGSLPRDTLLLIPRKRTQSGEHQPETGAKGAERV